MIVVDSSRGPVPTSAVRSRVARTQVLDGPWAFQLRPTLDNTFGDFQLPATPQRIGVQTRRLHAAPAQRAGRPAEWTDVTCGFGPRFWALGPFPPGEAHANLTEMLVALTAVDPTVPVQIAGHSHVWHPYEYSPALGIESDPLLTHWLTGPHGLKGQLPDEFVDLSPRDPVQLSAVAGQAGQNHGRANQAEV